MPYDLFGDVLVRPRSVRARRSSVVILSVVAHGTAIIALVIVPLLATDVLPTLSRSVTFIPDSNILPVVSAAPFRRSTKSHAPTENRTTADTTAAPIEAPSDIKQETDLKNPSSTVESVGSPDGIIDGLVHVGVVYTEPPPPPPPPPRPAPVRLHVGIRAPQKLVDVAPVYPPAAQLGRVEGVVIVEATIDARGNVIGVRVLKSIVVLDLAALDAVKQWKYTPALLNGVPVPVVMTVTVNFTLR